jgi:hypothetical protein
LEGWAYTLTMRCVNDDEKAPLDQRFFFTHTIIK